MLNSSLGAGTEVNVQMSYQSQILKIWMSECKTSPFYHKDSVILRGTSIYYFKMFCCLCLYWLFSSEHSWILWRYLILFPGVFFSSMSFSRAPFQNKQTDKRNPPWNHINDLRRLYFSFCRICHLSKLPLYS